MSKRAAAILESVALAVLSGAADAILATDPAAGLDPRHMWNSAIVGGAIGFAYWLRGPRGRVR